MSRARAARLRVQDLDDPERTLKKSTAVHAGQRLRAFRPVPDADAPRVDPQVLHEDEDLLVLDKPSGLAVHPTASRFRSTVTWWLRQRGRGEEPAHRLDAETSGVLVCSRNKPTDRALKALFIERDIAKTYLAVVRGDPGGDWVDDTPLGFDSASDIRLKMGPGDLPARTGFRTLRAGMVSLVEATPLTGRQHQIRVHLALRGTPILGDKIYGPDEGLFLASLERDLTPAEVASLGHHRLALHAHCVEFEWGGARRFEAPLPVELSALL